MTGVVAVPLESTQFALPVHPHQHGGTIFTTSQNLGTVGGPLHQVRNHIPILRHTQHIQGGLADTTDFQTGNGISVSENTQVVKGRANTYLDEQGQLVQTDSSLVKSGTISYTSPEGIPITLSYVADENGLILH